MEAPTRVEPWLDLSDSKQWSRILYTNPVCFLCCKPSSSSGKNVMVLSWLTPTNNAGSFMLSLSKHRYTAEVLLRDQPFTLSVPVQGMEELVLQVGGVSGRTGSKFPSDRPDRPRTIEGQQYPTSKRQKKKLLHTYGIEGLESIPIRGSGGDDDDDDDLFYIAGTVAHMSCRVTKILDDVIDADHRLVLAQVERACVHPSYWCSSKNLFRPLPSCPPYLTFFGSQTFGCVIPLLDNQLD